MILSYHKWSPEDRDRIRAIENKPHVGYIRYLLCQRMPFQRIGNELMKLGFSPVEPNELYFYFRQVIFPVFQKHNIQRYYYHYKIDRDTELLSFQNTFGQAEDDRKIFCRCIHMLEIEFFFANEILAYYNNVNFPVDPDTGLPIITIERTNALTQVLQHPKRHVIETMLADGKTPKHISAYLDKTFGVELEPRDIHHYANAFFKIRRKDLERTIEDLQEEKEQLESSLSYIRTHEQEFGSLSERAAAIGETKKKINDLDTIIKRLQGHHTHHAYHAGVLEYANLREMFADVMLRTHKRFVDIDDTQPETDAVNYLSTVVGMMSKATEKILSIDEKTKENSKKSVSDEMLEVIMPSMERIEREEREAFQKYNKLHQEDDTSQHEVLGYED